VELFIQNDNPTALIDSEAGEYQFCRFCLNEDTCSKKGFPKILPINMKIMRYANMFLDKDITYCNPYPGSWEYQPVYFNHLIEIAKLEILKQRKLKEGNYANAGS